MSAPSPLSLYIHIPFCKSKCAYCDFASFPGREAMWEAYFAALCGEIRAAGDDIHRVETVFFGGGTPSLVPETYIAGALAAAREAFPFAPGAEVSLEANPGTLTMEKSRAYREMGVNRLSIGVQSFDARLLKDIGRIHAPGEAVEAVRMAKAAGFANIGIDLMYGLPGQTMGAWEATLETALSLPLAHISAYALIVEEGTPMAARGDELPDEEDVLSMQRLCTRALAAAGFARYEISNYARRGFACRHNLVYWRRGEYLGFGCAAHSFFGGERFRNWRATCAGRGGWSASAWTARRRARRRSCSRRARAKGCRWKTGGKPLARTSAPGAKRFWISCAARGWWRLRTAVCA